MYNPLYTCEKALTSSLRFLQPKTWKSTWNNAVWIPIVAMFLPTWQFNYTPVFSRHRLLVSNQRSPEKSVLPNVPLAQGFR